MTFLKAITLPFSITFGKYLVFFSATYFVGRNIFSLGNKIIFEDDNAETASRYYVEGMTFLLILLNINDTLSDISDSTPDILSGLVPESLIGELLIVITALFYFVINYFSAVIICKIEDNTLDISDVFALLIYQSAFLGAFFVVLLASDTIYQHLIDTGIVSEGHFIIVVTQAIISLVMLFGGIYISLIAIPVWLSQFLNISTMKGFGYFILISHLYVIPLLPFIISDII